jgi:hypothetical protein
VTGRMKTTAFTEAFGGNPRPSQGIPFGKGGRAFGTPNPSQIKRRPIVWLGDISSNSWQRERAQRLARIFRCIETGHARGKRIHEMLVWFAWRWKSRCYKTDPGHSIRFGYGTLRRLYYQWKRGGKTPAAFALRYGAANRKLPASEVLAMARLCAGPGVRSFAAAWRRVPNPAATYHAFRHAMPVRVRKELTSLFTARRRVEFHERWAQRAIDSFAESISESAR